MDIGINTNIDDFADRFLISVFYITDFIKSIKKG